MICSALSARDGSKPKHIMDGISYVVDESTKEESMSTKMINTSNTGRLYYKIPYCQEVLFYKGSALFYS